MDLVNKNGKLNSLVLAVCFLFFAIAAIKTETSFPYFLGLGLALVLVYYYKSKIVLFVEKYERTFFGTFLFIGVALRSAWYFLASTKQSSDGAYYYETAQKILHGENFLSLGKQTGPSWMAAIGMFFFGNSERAASLPTFLASCIALLFVFYFLRRCQGAFPAIAGLGFMALWPEQIFYSNIINNSFFHGFFVLVAVFSLSQSMNTSSKKNLLLLVFSGVCLGISQYMRATGFLFLVAVAVYYILNFKIKPLVPVFLGFVLSTLPLLIFNWNELHIISFAPSQFGGYSLAIGTNLKSEGHFYDWSQVAAEVDEKANEMFPKDQPKSAADMNAAGTALAMDRIRSNPSGFLKMAFFQKMPDFLSNAASLGWSFEGTQVRVNSDLFNQLSNWTQKFLQTMVILSLFSIALIFWQGNSVQIEPIVVFIIGSSAVLVTHMIAEVQSQYHLSISGLYPLLAAAGLHFIPQRKDLKSKDANAR